MARATTVQTNFTTGEIAPEVLGRIDIAQYHNGAKELTNAYPVAQGGAYSRVGTIWTAEVKDSPRRTRVIPFVKTKDVRYVIEVGNFYLRFFKDGAAVGAPYELTSPYSESDLLNIDYVQDADRLYIAHEGFDIRRLIRYADANWVIGAAPFTTRPFKEIGLRPAVALTLSAKTVGVGRTVTAASAVFLVSDVGRAILCGPGIAVVTAYTDTQHVTAEITVEFDSVSVASNTWTLDSSPQTTLTPGAASPVGTVTPATLGAAGWRSSQVGDFIRINGGLMRITQFTSTTVVQARIEAELTSAVAAPALAWSAEQPQWNARDGYPRTITQFQQRLVAAGAPGFPQTIWGSRIGEPLDFQLGTNDDEAYSFTIGSDENNQIGWLSAARDLLVLSYGAEYAVRGGIEKPITPTNASMPPQSDHGSSDVRPTSVRKETVFVQASGKKLRGLTFDINTDGYETPDMLALAEHLTQRLTDEPHDGSELEITELAFQKEPYSILWAVRSDGLLLSCTVDRKQNVLGWAKHDVGATVESVCCVPGNGADVVYLVVRRLVNGLLKRYIERMEFTTTSQLLSSRHLTQFDCAVHLFDAIGSPTWTHPGLPNTTVSVLADGVYVGEYETDGSGAFTLGRTAYSVQAGLPFTATVVPTTPIIDTGMGTSAGQRMTTSEVRVQVLRTGPIEVNGTLQPFANFGSELLDQPQQLYTGFVAVPTEGWSDGTSDIRIERKLPFPMKVLSVVRRFTANAD